MQIKDLPSSNTLAATDVLAKDTSGGTTQRITGQDLADGVKSLAGAASSNQLADAYSSSATYAVGDYCIKDNVLYKCNTAISTAEAWTAAHWTATDIGTELQGRLMPGDVVNNLTSTSIDKPLSANMGKALNDNLAKVTGTIGTHEYTASTIDNVNTLFKTNGIVYINLEIRGDNGATFPVAAELFSIPSGFRPSANVRLPAILHHKTADVWVSYYVIVTSTGKIKQEWSSSCDGISISSFYML